MKLTENGLRNPATVIVIALMALILRRDGIYVFRFV